MGTKFLKPIPLLSLRQRLRQGKLDLKPWYQRESVWTRPQKRLLIDSILRGYDIPKLYFNVVTDRKPIECEVVDGHQRLDAIFEFFDDKFAMPEDADAVDGIGLAGSTFSQLHTDLQQKFEAETFDVVMLENYTTDEIEDMFGRFQNGSPLNAAEKRRVIPGNMRKVVESVAAAKMIENLAGYKNKRYAFEDVAAKLIHLSLAEKIVDVRADSIRKTYTDNKGLKIGDARVKQILRAMNFVSGALKSSDIRLNKVMSVVLPIFAMQLARDYDIYQHQEDFKKWYTSFEKRRIGNSEKGPDDSSRDNELDRYTDSLRNDSVQALTYIESVLRRSLFSEITDIAPLDPQRGFSDDQRYFIFQRDGGICQGCGKVVNFDAFHADHVKKHSQGGKTSIENGRVLCIPCNTSGRYN